MIPASTPLLPRLMHIRSCLVLALAASACALGGCKSPLDDVNIKDVYGPAGRAAKNNLIEQAKKDVKGDPEVGQVEFEAAKKLYDEQNYVAARNALKKLRDKYKKKSPPVEEDILFYLAESNYQLAYYPAAQDGYDELLKKYGSTKYFEQSIRRLFAIGRYWLKSPKPASEIELASFKDENGGDKLDQLQEAYDPGEFRVKPNFTDKTRPFFDTPGRGVQALRSVHVLDSSGPLADDAVMILALYHLRKRDYREADTYFSQIRETYHKSEFLKDAYVLGAHASYKSYLGPRYDGKQLEEAKKLTKSATRLFPDLPQRPKLENDLKKMDAEEIEREWQRVLYYKKRGEKEAAAVYCEWIIERHPDSPQAMKARELLIEFGPKYAQGIMSEDLFAPKKKLVPANEAESTGSESAKSGPVEATSGPGESALTRPPKKLPTLVKPDPGKAGPGNPAPGKSVPGKSVPVKQAPGKTPSADSEPVSDELEEPARLRVSDGDDNAKPISKAP